MSVLMTVCTRHDDVTSGDVFTLLCVLLLINGLPLMAWRRHCAHVVYSTCISLWCGTGGINVFCFDPSVLISVVFVIGCICVT